MAEKVRGGAGGRGFTVAGGARRHYYCVHRSAKTVRADKGDRRERWTAGWWVRGGEKETTHSSKTKAKATTTTAATTTVAVGGARTNILIGGGLTTLSLLSF